MHRAMAGWSLLFLFGASCYGGDVAVQSFASRKVLHDFNENAVLAGSIVNRGAQARPVVAELRVRKGVDREFPGPKRSITLGPGKEERVEFSWNPGTDEYGYAAVLVVRSPAGEVLASSRPAVFEVSRDWRKMQRQVSLGVTGGYFDPDRANSGAEQMDRIIALLKEYSTNVVEFYDEFGENLSDLAPAGETWLYPLHGIRHPDRPPVKISRTKVREWVARLHEAGMKVIGYTHTPKYPLPDESWKVYDASSGRQVVDPESGPAARPWLDARRIGTPNALKYKDALAGQLVRSIRMFDWDGWFLDSFNHMIELTAKGVDKGGKPLTAMTSDEVYAAVLKTLTETTRKAKESFVIVPNGLHHVLAGIELNPSRDMFGGNLEGFRYPKGNRYAPLWFYEGQETYNRANSPWQTGRALRAVREATGRPVWTIFFHSKFDNERMMPVETAKPFLALILSNGLGYWDHFGGIWIPAPEKHPTSAAIADYLRFAARYGQYLYDLDIRWTPRDMVTVEAPEHVYWKGNSFLREFKDRREVYVHLLNYDRPYLQAKLMARDHAVPEPVRDIRARVAVPADWETAKARAYWVNADGDQEPAEIAVSRAGGRLETVVPALEYWSMLVVKLPK